MNSIIPRGYSLFNFHHTSSERNGDSLASIIARTLVLVAQTCIAYYMPVYSLSDVPISQGTSLTQFIEQQRALLSNALIWYRSFCERTNRVCKRIFCQNKDAKDIERLKRDFYKINLRTMPPNATNETFWDDLLLFFVFFIEIKLVLFCTCLLLTKKMIFN